MQKTTAFPSVSKKVLKSLRILLEPTWHGDNYWKRKWKVRTWYLCQYLISVFGGCIVQRSASILIDCVKLSSFRYQRSHNFFSACRCCNVKWSPRCLGSSNISCHLPKSHISCHPMSKGPFGKGESPSLTEVSLYTISDIHTEPQTWHRGKKIHKMLAQIICRKY